jgi:hypothetical protein
MTERERERDLFVEWLMTRDALVSYGDAISRFEAIRCLNRSEILNFQQINNKKAYFRKKKTKFQMYGFNNSS